MWHATLEAPPKTPYGANKVTVLIKCPHAYGVDPPRAWFDPIIPHVNADETGRIACSYLARWTLESNLLGLCDVILGLLVEPEPDFALNGELCAAFRDTPAKYKRAVARALSSVRPKHSGLNDSSNQ